ncbi:hypothetical protein QFX18_11720 [Saccharophagus degradans]|uniref:DUF6586 family protein n=1 Tax=Saccharophagus degradans TaxID=86304 RepID=UPI002477F426|nr:DUF6586 family protein [Saccharophagus degradans]WGO96715.1 hypothetical protein QFX18_11720 [Saccharophagus degradans]
MSKALKLASMVNQQLAFAKSLWQQAESLGAGFNAHACKQAGIMQLCTGLCLYAKEIGLVEDEALPVSVNAILAKLLAMGDGVGADFRYEQLRDLARDDSSWLAHIAAIEPSLFEPKPVPAPADENIIAVSLGAQRETHWLNVELATLQGLRDQCAGLIRDQREVSSEY